MTHPPTAVRNPPDGQRLTGQGQVPARPSNLQKACKTQEAAVKPPLAAEWYTDHSTHPMTGESNSA